MTIADSPSLEALPNPRGGAVPEAEAALVEARQASEAQLAVVGPLLRAAQALRQAGWLASQRFVDALVLVSPYANDEFLPRFRAALTDFHAALTRHNLRELACSPALFSHYRELNAQVARHTQGYVVAFEDLALTGRPIAPATLRETSGASLRVVRARYEQALLPVLKEHEGVSAALDELDACIAELAGDDTYDVWRLAGACARALRVSGRARAGDPDAKRFYARCNLLLAEQGQGVQLAPRSFVRAALASLWRDYALYGAAAEDADSVQILHDYGLTVDWHVAATQASEAAWEASAAQAEAATAAGAPAAGGSVARDLGALSVNVYAYEDFLQTADAAMAALAVGTDAAFAAATPDAAAAEHAGQAAYRLGAAAQALGLGHVALLADALGLAWRRQAYAARIGAASFAPARRPMDQAGEALRAMLLRVAAGFAQPDSAVPLALLVQAIERAVPAAAPAPSSSIS
jgi:phosphohistidine phosphatase SixA